MGVDWSHRADYMATRHGVSVAAAEEALADPDRLVFDPDYASVSGRSVRTIGQSISAGRLLTVITVAEDGATYGGVRLGVQRHRRRPLPRTPRGREP